MIKDAAYWIAFAHLPKWRYLRLNELLVKIYIEDKSNLEEFFNLSEKDVFVKYEDSNK